MRVLVAVLMGIVILGVGWSTLRGFSRPAPGPRIEAVQPPKPGVRVMFWCENCGTEVMLVRKGSEAPPRHCGEPMQKREEVLGQG